ncbi:MAG: hypothetical protein QXK06_04575 [Candidatus Diapherotrites archaeon]
MGHEITPHACKSRGFTEFYTEITKKRSLGSLFTLQPAGPPKQ